jgi:hypothetical protein
MENTEAMKLRAGMSILYRHPVTGETQVCRVLNRVHTIVYVTKPASFVPNLLHVNHAQDWYKVPTLPRS